MHEQKVTFHSAAGATANGAVMNCSGLNTVLAQITGTFVATVNWEATVDGTNWVALYAVNCATGAVATTATVPGLYQVVLGGARLFRARLTWTSGTSVTVTGLGVEDGVAVAAPLSVIGASVAVTTTGGAGAASGSGVTTPINGLLWGVYLDYAATAPATTDVTISYTTAGGNILVVSNNATDGWYFPRRQCCDAAGAAIAGAYDENIVADTLTVSVAQSNPLSPCVTAYFYWTRA